MLVKVLDINLRMRDSYNRVSNLASHPVACNLRCNTSGATLNKRACPPSPQTHAASSVPLTMLLPQLLVPVNDGRIRKRYLDLGSVLSCCCRRLGFPYKCYAVIVRTMWFICTLPRMPLRHTLLL